MLTKFRGIGILLLALSLRATSLAENWPRFRGPGGNGVGSENADRPIQWSTTENVRWVAEVPGWGWSSPVVWEDKVFLTTVVSEEENTAPSKGLYLGRGVREPAKGIHHWLVLCYDLNSGELLWKHEAHTGHPAVPRHPKSTYAAESPVTDGENVYVLFGDVGLYSFKPNGVLNWSRKIEPKKTFFDYGAAASPVCHNGQVFVVYDNLEDSWIASYDAHTGATVWQQARDETHSWATPLVWKNDLRTELVVPGKKFNRSYSLDGKLLWQFDGEMSNLVIPSPFAAHGMCYIASGYVGDAHRPTFAIRPGASGDFTPDGDYADSESIAWYQGTSSSYNPSQIVYGDYLYTLYDQGFLTCHDAITGKQVYGKRRFSPAGSFTASPFAYNGHVFCLSEDGLTYVVKAGPQYELVAKNNLDELCIACPATVDENLLIRSASKLYCMSKGAQLSPEKAAAMKPRRPSQPGAAFWKAIEQGDVKALNRELDGGQRIDAKRPGSRSTALSSAAMFGHLAIGKALLQRGAKLNETNPDGNTALHLAAFFAREDFVEWLLDKGADRAIKNRRGETPADIVRTPWNDGLQRIYTSISGALGVELDLQRVRQTRPVVLGMLQDQGDASDTQSDSESKVSLSSEGADRLRELIRESVESGKVAGASHLVVSGGNELFFEAAGVRDIEDRAPFSRDTILRIYSMSKPITSVAAMRLYEQGKFDLDDPVSKYIESFASAKVYQKSDSGTAQPDAKRSMTVRDVLRHTTGYAYGGNGNAELEKQYVDAGLKYRGPGAMFPPELSIAAAADALAQIPAHHYPGERFTYGFSTDMLGRLIEVWSGEPLDVHLKKSVFEPLEMKDTGFVVATASRERFASCHTTVDGELKIIDKANASPFTKGFAFLSGGGGLVSTIDDYGNFCRMLANQGTFGDQSVLKPETVKLMFSDQLGGVAGGFQFGLGFAIADVSVGDGDGARKFRQVSWGGYASTDFRIVPELGLYQIVLRQHVPSSHQLANRLFPVVYENLKLPESLKAE